MTFRHFFILLSIVFGLALVPAAQAANFFVNDSVEGQITLTHDANWEFGVLSNGFPFAARVTGSTTVPGELATFSGSWVVNSPGTPDPGTGVIYFVDQPANSCHRRHHHHRFSFDHHGRGCGRSHRGDHGRGKGQLVVSDIVTANWSTVSRKASISFMIISSACGQSLGRLPQQFAGLGVPDPASPIQIGGLFRDPVTAAPVAIPSNLTIQFVGNADTACPRGGDDEDDD